MLAEETVPLAGLPFGPAMGSDLDCETESGFLTVIVAPVLKTLAGGGVLGGFGPKDAPCRDPCPASDPPCRLLDELSCEPGRGHSCPFCAAALESTRPAFAVMVPLEVVTDTR